ncbi:putative hybrid sensor and regulator protein [Oryzomicrobium terrae]|uniref:Sensory/regulatory protein RpfC n=1 Tax=Oryzomicrobium terrae TaxID=1735038 RepID=A0A5C1E7C4_9RHOO|nr:PAS domain S-box protein [Oryzomicrobium terrae]QEL64831.1 putative hybrid sensor and regulator protein [Oryzomicrobium terrae]
MHHLLTRQLSRFLGVADPAQGARVLADLRQLAARPDVAPETAAALAGLEGLLAAVDEAYQHQDRTLALQTSSLERNARELEEANARLSQDLAVRRGAVESLREIANRMLAQAGLPAISPQDDSLEAITLLLDDLVLERESTRAQLDGALRALEQQQAAVDRHAIVSIADVTGRITYVNDKFVQISGYSRDELLEQNHRILNSGHHPPEFFDDLWRTIAAGQVWSGDICNRSKSGHNYWVNATIVPFVDAQGRPYQYVAIRTDITARIEAEEKLDAQLHFTRQLIESIPVPLYFKDTEGFYLGFNKAFEDFFCLRREEWLGRHVRDLLPPDIAAFHATRDEELIQHLERQSYELEVVTLRGERRVAFYSKAPLTRPDGTASGLIGTILDISDRKRWEQEILRAKEAAEAANQTKSDFLANMSHEIRTPMNGILGMTELALDTALDEEQREYLQAVKRSADALLVVINDILDFSKIEAGKLDVESVPFDLEPVIGDALRGVALRAEQKGIELLADIDADVPGRLLGDPGRLRQILLNLLSNAVKFTARGEVAVGVHLERQDADGLLLHFTVRDSGIGIAPEKCQIIFEPFSQEDASTTRNYGGTGLGLTICSRLAALMGGYIWVESTVGKGSTFQFTVRLQPLSPQSEPPLPLAGRRAVVALRHPEQAATLCRQLAALGMAACPIENAAALATTDAADLYAIDVDLPLPAGTTWEAVLDATGVMPAQVLLLTRISAPTGGGLRDWGVRWAIPKPALPGELRHALAQWCGQPGEKGVAGRPLRVLLAEDHPVNQRLMSSVLARLGHQVVVAEDGEAAVEKARDETVDLILMDMQMPRLDGLTATARIRAEARRAGRRRVPVYALSAAVEDVDRGAGEAAGLDGYLGKPLAQEALRSVLESAAVALGPARKTSGGTPVAQEAQDAKEDYARLLAQADPDIVGIIGQVFIETAPRDARALAEAHAAQDWEALARVAHTIKGSIANFAAENLVHQAGALEAAAHSGQVEPAAVETLAAEYQRFCDALASYLARTEA